MATDPKRLEMAIEVARKAGVEVDAIERAAVSLVQAKEVAKANLATETVAAAAEQSTAAAVEAAVEAGPAAEADQVSVADSTSSTVEEASAVAEIVSKGSVPDCGAIVVHWLGAASQALCGGGVNYAAEAEKWHHRHVLVKPKVNRAKPKPRNAN